MKDASAALSMQIYGVLNMQIYGVRCLLSLGSLNLK